ncbi:GTP pyrophosphokinase [Sporosalibacterium faouarense]|uniref:GTP pyrophosphokinase n=1 Tax=Sporosalibacterium faouarense TaxID=516123 RepID=UPI00141D650E|nr:GTP pyrophosphokinase family protein [Sporosalibacterium faouarense]MTI47155.1 GTP pyrophosphokinase family protein [Bacillota bacterium]
MHTNIAANEVEEWTNMLLIYKFAIEEVNTKLKILNEEFQYIHKHNPIEHLKDRVKKPKSIMKKLQRKGIDITIDNARKHIHDIAGIRVICSFTSDIYTLFEMIKKQSDIKVIEVKDYIKSPKPNGYKSLHMIIEIPVFLSRKKEYVKVEIQIRTVAMDFWASLEHKIYYKYDKSVPDNLMSELKQVADSISQLDRKMENIHKTVNRYKESEDIKDDTQKLFVFSMPI